MNRRVFTKKCILASSSLLSAKGMITTIGTEVLSHKKIPKTDTHVHLFDLENLRYSWLKNAPEINRSFTIEDFQKASKKSNIGKILFMESGADAGQGVKEAKWVASLVEKEPRIKGIIAKLDLNKGNDIAEDLDQMSETKLLKGIRGGFSKESADSSAFLDGLKLLASRNLSFDLLLTPPLLASARSLAQKCPNNVFILDHIGNPDIKSGEMDLWKKGIQQLAAIPNVNCKVSGIITRVGKEWSQEKIKPYVLYIIEQFGMDRLVYGGDWPVVLRADSYKNWSKVFEKLTRSFSKNELNKLYHANADKVYNL